MGPKRVGDARDFYLLAITYFGALRTSETVCMRSSFIRVEHGEMLVPSVKRKVRSGVSVDSKTGRPLLRIPILHGDKILSKAASWGGDRLWIFPSPMDELKPLTTRQFRYTFKRWAQVAGFDPRISAHSLRHSAITHVHEAVGDEVLCRDYARHSNISVTNTYLHASPATIRRARKAMRGFRE